MEITNLNQIKKDHNIDVGVGAIISNAFKIGFQNWGRMILAYLLFVCVFWVPYINIGAYIGLTGFVVTMSKGKKISPTDMFNNYYLKKIGDYALLTFLFIGGIVGLLLILWNFGTYIALFTCFVPLIVIFYSWSMSAPLLLDKDLGALQSLEISNKITYEYKGTMFGANILMGLIFLAVGIVFSLLAFGLGSIIQSHGAAIAFIVFMVILLIAVGSFLSSVWMGMQAYIYRVLEKRISIDSHVRFIYETQFISDNTSVENNKEIII